MFETAAVPVGLVRPTYCDIVRQKYFFKFYTLVPYHLLGRSLTRAKESQLFSSAADHKSAYHSISVSGTKQGPMSLPARAPIILWLVKSSLYPESKSSGSPTKPPTSISSLSPSLSPPSPYTHNGLLHIYHRPLLRHYRLQPC